MNVLIDTGPIVALLDKRDKHHRFVDREMRRMEAPFYTCEAVITESFFLMQRVPTGIERLIEMLESGKLEISFKYSENILRVHHVIKNYPKLPASFADACLVAMADTIKNPSIFTLDDDFTIYRDSDGEPLSLIIPE